MGNLPWNTGTHIENSCVEYLRERIEGDSGDTPLTVFFKGKTLPINVRVGYPEDAQEWKDSMPMIICYESSTNNPRPFVGTTKLIPETLLIIQVYALHERMRSDLSRWVRDTINPGFEFYSYEPNHSNPEEPIKTLEGRANIQFISDAPIRLPNVDVVDQFRHSFSVSVTIN